MERFLAGVKRDSTLGGVSASPPVLHNEVKLQDYVDVAFKELFFNVSQDEKPEYNGVQLINSAVISRYLKQLLENDLRYTPFTFVGSEQPVQEDIEIKTPKGIIKSRIG